MQDKYENIFKMTILGNQEYLLNCYLRPNDNFVKCSIFSGNEYIFLTSFPFISLVSLTHSQKKFYKKCFISFLQKKFYKKCFLSFLQKNWETFFSQLKVFFFIFISRQFLFFDFFQESVARKQCFGSGSVWIRIH